jgi:hypothetical protein
MLMSIRIHIQQNFTEALPDNRQRFLIAIDFGPDRAGAKGTQIFVLISFR